MSFGSAGAYERVIGVARGEIDPGDPRNAGIVNIEKAQRNAAGLVEYEADVFMLRPVDPQRRNGKVLYEFLNRGRKLLLTWVNDAPEIATGPNSDPRTAADAGTGFSLRDGWTLVWSGWDGTIARDGVLMGIGLPVARGGGGGGGGGGRGGRGGAGGVVGGRRATRGRCRSRRVMREEFAPAVLSIRPRLRCTSG